MTATAQPAAGTVWSISRVLIAVIPVLCGCASGTAQRHVSSGYAGQSTRDALCIREHELLNEPFPETARDCGARFPDLTNEPDLQRRAAGVGQPFIATALGRDGKDHWYLCRMTGLHPGDLPSSTSPFRCRWLDVTSPHRGRLNGQS